MKTSTFVDLQGKHFVIGEMTKEYAQRRSDRLLELHNRIPNQNWTVSDLLAEQDEARRFPAKWKISRWASRKVDQEPIAFCIGFETPATQYFPSAGVYMHRAAVDPSERKSGIGALTHMEACIGALDRGISLDGQLIHSFPIYGQTPTGDWNQAVLEFWLDSGYRVIGKKRYSQRFDYVMEMTPESLRASKHYELWLECKRQAR